MILIAAMLLAAQDAPPPSASPPDLIDTVAPYLECLLAPPPADCSAVRAKTVKALDRVFAQQGGMSERERRDQAESVLAALDLQVGRIRAAGPPPEGSAVVDGLSSSRSFPWALREQVGRYTTCVSDNFNRLLKTTPGIREGAQVRVIFADAKNQCAAVRTTASAGADAILRPTEPADEKRAKIIANALDTVDSQGESFAAAVDRAAAESAKQQ